MSILASFYNSSVSTFTLGTVLFISLLSIDTWPVNRLGWSALCQMVYKEPFPGKSSVAFLPMIDMDPSDMTCIYSTLN
jgi:hypothetical protein